MVVVLCTISGCLLGLSPKAWFDVKGKIQAHAYIMLLDRGIFFIGSLFFLYVLRNEYVIIHVCLCMLLGRLVMSALEWKYIRETTSGLAFEGFSQFLRQAIQNNLWVWLAAIGNLLMTHFNQILVDVQMGAQELGLYSFAFQLITMVKILQNQLLRLSTPAISEIVDSGSAKAIYKFFIKNCALSLGPSIVIVCCALLLAPWFVSTFVGEDFMGTIPIFNMLCLWILLFGIALMSNQFLLSFHLQKSYFFITMFFGILSIFLAYKWIGMYGAVGAAMSLLAAHFGSILVQTILVIRQIKNHVRTT